MGQSFTHANSDGDPEGESGRDDRLMLIDDAHWSRYTSEKLPPIPPHPPSFAYRCAAPYLDLAVNSAEL